MKEIISNYLNVAFFILILNCCCSFVQSENISNVTNYSFSSRPNIIVIIADDLGWNDVSFNGADQIPTPNIDALAYNGVILRKHYVSPVCTASRSAFLTGYNPFRQGMQGEPLHIGEKNAIPKRFKLLPEYLKNLGYSTHLVGKWHVGYYAPRYTPTSRGFDTFFGYYNGFIQYSNHTVADAETRMHMGNDLHRDKVNKLSPDFTTGYFTNLITEEAEKIISTHDPVAPLYLQVAHLATHASGLSNGEELQVEDFVKVNQSFKYIEDINRRKLAGVISSMDQSVGRVVNALQKAQMLDNSVILFFSDNGAQTIGQFMNHGSNYPLRGMKNTAFEGGVRSASCIYSPLIKRYSTISNQLIHITDWLPTLYSVAGGNLKDLNNVDGFDQWNVISRNHRNKRDRVLLNIDNDMGEESAIIGKYKLIKRKDLNYVGYYGDSGNDNSYPLYEMSNVILSPTARAIFTATKKRLTVRTIEQLRQQTKLPCQPPKLLTECGIYCLFDLSTDPCETNDISRYYPKIVDNLRNYIDDYKKHVVNRKPPHVDPNSYPENWEGTWMPFVTDDDDDRDLVYPKYLFNTK